MKIGGAPLMRISSAKVILSLVFIFFGSVIAFSYQNEYKFKDYAPISFRNNSSDWHNRNDHLIPNEVEAYAVLSLDQERDFSGKDIDYDGVPNQLDPSPYDWREAGYQPFGVLEFLSWRHPWNNYKYDEKSLIKLLS